MEVVERLTLESAQADTMLASEHRQRYAFAVRLCPGLRVLDLCCGSGYGTAILAARAREVVGVDNDAATIETAQATVGREHENTSFQLADAVTYLRDGRAAQGFDVLVCFEGLEHLRDLDRALTLLRESAERGLRLIASVPNSKMFKEQNPFHVTDFGYDEAMAAFARFPATTMLPQFLAEGSLICPPGAQETEVTVTLEGRDEPEYANHFIFCVNFDSAELTKVHHGKIQVNSSPIFNRWSEGLKHAIAGLRRENARLARGRLGKANSAAASALAVLQDREAQVVALQKRCQLAEAKIEQLELQVLVPPAEGVVAPAEGVVAPAEGVVAPAEGVVAPAEDSTGQRADRAPEG